MKEAEIWEGIVKVKAEKRMKAGVKQNNPSINCSQGIEKGRTRDIVAPKIGISGSTYIRAKLAFNEIKRLEKEGKTQDAKFLTAILNENVRGAKDIVKSNKISKISDELKTKVIKKEIPVKQAVQTIL